MKKLTKIRLINWHYFPNETIEVKNNILLTGANASGKSTIMDAITFVVTAGDTSFNMAANDKGKRDLRGYVKCKLGIDDKEYLREGDVSGHIALEFFDESTNNYFTVGSVIDAFGDLTPVKVMFYEVGHKIEDSMFVSPEGIIHGTVEFRKNNSNFEYYLTKKEARRGFRTAFGSINEDFFRLIPKALAFKPISDVKEFIYQNILEEKQIDVSSIKDSIRSYKELENTLNVIKTKISDLKLMESNFNEIREINEQKNYLLYLMRLSDQEKVIEENKKYTREIETLIEKKGIKQSEIKEIELEVDALNERSKELYIALSNNEVFKAEEYLDKQIAKARQNIEDLEGSQDVYLKRASYLKDLINELRKTSTRSIYNELANISFVKINSEDIEATKLKLTDINSRLDDVVAEVNQELGRLEVEKNNLLVEINEISQTLRGLDQNKLRYNPSLISIKNEISNGLKRIYGYDISVHIFAELIEITDKEWADTIEIFLGNRRFDFIVEPRYFDSALQIFSRIKNNYRLYGVGLVNTKQLEQYNKFQPNSLASILTSDNIDAKRYVNMTCGNVIMCRSEMELEKYQTAITNDGLIYRGYTVRSLNPNIEKPFIGKNALSEQTELWNQRALEKKTEYLQLNERINLVRNELSILSKLEFTAIVKDIDNAYTLSKETATLAALLESKNRQKDMTVSDLEDDYHKILQTIKNYDAKKIAISEEIGGIANSIEKLKETISQNSSFVENGAKELALLINDNYQLEQKAKQEYLDMKKIMSSKEAAAEYQKRFNVEESNYASLSDSLLNKQFNYINKYSSTFSIGVTEMDKYLNELNKLEKSELIKYEQKVRSAREEAEIIFKEDFLSKLRNNIMTAENEISKINETLAQISFGRDKYEFIFPKSKEYSQFYEMVTSDLNEIKSGLFTFDFQVKYDQQLEELFATLSIDELNSNGAINKFTDYRTYMDYDIKITNENGESMTYSKVFKEKSGGETQVPFYVAIIASFVRVYTKNRSTNDTIGLVLFDEVFDKMDAGRMGAMMEFINSMPLQVIIACPPQRMGILADFTDTTLVMVRKNNRAQVLPITKTELEEMASLEYSDEKSEE